MHITIELRRPARCSVALTAAALLLLTPAVVLASHQFNDVPSDHPFHADIDAIAGAGITSGFNDGGYHPGDAVTRQAMAAFMNRGFGRVGLAGNAAPTTAQVTALATELGTNYVPVRELTITVPGVNTPETGPQQLVHAQGRVVFFSAMNASRGCPCEFAARIRDTTSQVVSPEQSDTFETTAQVWYFQHSVDVEGLFYASPGSRTFVLEVALNFRNDGVNAADFLVSQQTSLSAMTFPFGPTGDN